MSIESDLRDVNKALELVINNRIKDALAIVEPKSTENMSHAYGYSLVACAERANVDMKTIKGVSSIFKSAMKLIEKERKRECLERRCRP